ncbi:hypothetical protein [Larkinella rosea]|uniref:Uncharacterized protein n=1 Tax=Larkinella rosea TaxID=2025312 RepID=A0A3P1BZK5_9BACT|nr:hypothetical protein [Larkinella rosea]RRB06296.1 hypothetical protein EHT25_00375 [Larkinella rosea]
MNTAISFRMPASMPFDASLKTSNSKSDLQRPANSVINPLSITGGHCRSSFEASLIFMAAGKCYPPTSRYYVYVAYLKNFKVVEVQRLMQQRGYNHIIALGSVIKRAKVLGVTDVILCTSTWSTNEQPFAEEQIDEVVNQYETLRELFGLNLIDNIRLSPTCFYSYYADCERPYRVPQKDRPYGSIDRHYTLSF